MDGPEGCSNTFEMLLEWLYGRKIHEILDGFWWKSNKIVKKYWNPVICHDSRLKIYEKIVRITKNTPGG